VIEMAKEQISLRIEKEVLNRIDEIANLAEMDRSRLIVNILDEATKTLISTKKVGILQLSFLLRNMGEWMNRWAENIKKKRSIDEF
jgi:hypothetical protein